MLIEDLRRRVSMNLIKDREDFKTGLEGWNWILIPGSETMKPKVKRDKCVCKIEN